MIGTDATHALERIATELGRIADALSGPPDKPSGQPAVSGCPCLRPDITGHTAFGCPYCPPPDTPGLSASGRPADSGQK